jgi:TonB dependent receptor/TonB-dependent Receptor Plug Domain
VKAIKSALVLSILLVSHALMAQSEKRALKTVLDSLSVRYSVTFTFLDDVIANVVCEMPPARLTLHESLNRLTTETGLVFTQLNQQSVTVHRPPTADVCGYVVDRDTGDKIPGAVVQCGTANTITDQNGYFSFSQVAFDSRVNIRSFGYDSLSLQAQDISGSECKTLSLHVHTSILTELVVSRYLTVGIQKKREGSLAIQTKKLGLLPGLTEPDVLFTLQALPGIQSIDETVSNINVRGGTHDQNLVLFDGVKMYQQGHFFGMISAFNPYFTNEVELIKNGTSAFYSDGVSSTIDIRSEDKVAQKFSGGAGVNMLNADVFTKIPLSEKTSLHVATRRSLADVVETPTYKAYYDRAFRGSEIEKYTSADSLNTDQKFHFYDLSAKFLYDVTPADKLRANFLMIHNSIDYQETELVNNLPESKNSSLKQESLAGSIIYERTWSNTVRTSALGYVSRYALAAINSDVLNDQRLRQQNEVLDIGFKLDTRIALGNLADLHTGYQFAEVSVSNQEAINNPSFFRLKKDVLRSHVLFSEIGYTSPSAATSIRGGLRANYFSTKHKFRIEPRLAATQKLGPYISLELLGELKSQTTTQVIDFQNDFLGVEKRRWVMADGDTVPIITSQQVSAGLQFHKKDFLIVLEGYTKRVSDIITASQGFQNQFQYTRSAGKYTTNGIDFLINWRIQKFNCWSSYSFARSTYQFTELIPSTFPNNLDIRHRATGGVAYQADHLEISLGVNWRTGKPFTRPATENSLVDGVIQYEKPNKYRIQAYWRFDASAKYKFYISKKIRAIAGMSLWNMTGTDNVIDAFYRVNNNDQISFIQRNALGFTPNMMFRIEF